MTCWLPLLLLLLLQIDTLTNEAIVWACLGAHNNIASLYAAFYDARGRVMKIASELCDGSLTDLMKQ